MSVSICTVVDVRYGDRSADPAFSRRFDTTVTVELASRRSLAGSLAVQRESMTISSRTPEGTPNRCVVCGHDCRLEPSIDTRDGPCPSCGHLLWFPESRGRRSENRTWAYSAGAFVRKQLKRLVAAD
jgi:hypothetical protein